MLSTIQVEPGIWSDDTDTVSENRFVDGSNVRFRLGKAEVIGGWQKVSNETFTSYARGADVWANLEGRDVIGFGTSSVLYGLQSGDISDITPKKVLTTLTDPFTTVNSSATVTVTHTNHGLISGDTINFTHADAVGGITPDGDYTVQSVVDVDTYTITHSGAASSGATGGGYVDAVADLDAGNVSSLSGAGYGTGTYSSGTYSGSTGTSVTRLRIWSVDNWGENMLAVPSGGGLYEWRPRLSYDDQVTTGDFSSSTGWTEGTGWSIGSGVATASAGTGSDLSQDATATLVPGVRYKLVFTATVSAGTCQFQIVSSDLGDVDIGDPIDKAGTYTRYFYCPATPTLFQFAKDSSFAGTLDDVAITPIDIAYRIENAPPQIGGMFVDPHRLVVVYDCTEFDGDYGPLHVRWSAQEDNTLWTPAPTNIAGDYTLAEGSRIIAGMPGRGQNFLWTDSSLYTMRFTGDFNVFSFDLVGSGCGIISQMGAAEHNGGVWWWGNDYQWYQFDGGAPSPIPCPFRREIQDNSDPDYEDKIAAGVNSQFSEVWWFYCDMRDGTTEPSRYVSYNWQTGVWSKGVLARTSWIKTKTSFRPIAFGTDNYVYEHERGSTNDGSVISWYVETGLIDIGDGDNLYRVHRYMPDFDDQVGGMLMTLTSRAWPRDTAFRTTTHNIAANTADIPIRHKGRQLRIRWESNETCRFMRFGDQRIDLRQSGERRTAGE